MNRLAALLAQLAPSEGHTLSALGGVKFMRANQAMGRTPVMYEPCICFVVQGRKRGELGGQAFVYDSQHYLVLSVPLPFYVETEASEEEPLLALSIEVDRSVLADLLVAIDQSETGAAATPRGMLSTPMDARLSDTLLRLLQALASPLEARILGPALVREICFRVLMGEQGAALRAALSGQSHFGRIAKALRRIHANHAGQFDVSTLAGEASMSVPAFHAHFKAVTQCSPIQYIKSARLHQARLLMVRSDMTAQAASAQVGYESASQFSREFKRLFGRSPVEEAHAMRRALAMVPALLR